MAAKRSSRSSRSGKAPKLTSVQHEALLLLWHTAGPKYVGWTPASRLARWDPPIDQRTLADLDRRGWIATRRKSNTGTIISARLTETGDYVLGAVEHSSARRNRGSRRSRR
jgi:hypothetical protein